MSIGSVLRKRDPAAEPKSRKTREKRKDDKEYIVRKNTTMKILRGVLWTILAFLMLRGAISILRPADSETVEAALAGYSDEIAAIRTDIVLENEILSFAETFASDYYTYDLWNRKEFRARIKPYLSNSIYKIVEDTDVHNFDFDSCRTIYANAYKTETVSDNQKDVYVSIQTQYVENGEKNSFVLKVPVYISDAGFCIENLPMLVTDAIEDTGSYETVPVGQRELEIENLDEVITNFLSAYYGESQPVLDYFLTENADKTKFQILGGRWSVEKINAIKAYEVEGEPDKSIAIVNFALCDINGNQFLQRYTLLLSLEDNQILIEDINTRTNNINLVGG